MEENLFSQNGLKLLWRSPSAKVVRSNSNTDDTVDFMLESSDDSSAPAMTTGTTAQLMDLKRVDPEKMRKDLEFSPGVAKIMESYVPSVIEVGVSDALQTCVRMPIVAGADNNMECESREETASNGLIGDRVPSPDTSAGRPPGISLASGHVHKRQKTTDHTSYAGTSFGPIQSRSVPSALPISCHPLNPWYLSDGEFIGCEV
jgi:hypothetical protein